MISFKIEDDKAIINNLPHYGWLRKEDVLYEIHSTIETWEHKLGHYKEGEPMYHETQGRIYALKILYDEIKKA